MEQTFKATEIKVGFHPNGYRIDKTASPVNRYTKWQIQSGNKLRNPQSVCFGSLPQKGWFAKDKFDWNKSTVTEDYA
ncbi:MAG: hypothetical protein OEW48_17755 [Phycisphaerae bacterium]|nr:hypothetical protein [Phycisphaerae bacterium]